MKKNQFYGKTFTPEQTEKISGENNGRVKNPPTREQKDYSSEKTGNWIILDDIYYNSHSRASDATGIAQSVISRAVKKGQSTIESGGKIWTILDAEPIKEQKIAVRINDIDFESKKASQRHFGFALTTLNKALNAGRKKFTSRGIEYTIG